MWKNNKDCVHHDILTTHSKRHVKMVYVIIADFEKSCDVKSDNFVVLLSLSDDYCSD